MKWINKYWWWILIVLTLPFVINSLLLIPAFTKIVGDNTIWLSFWGCYLGSIISAGCAFIVLHIQRTDNYHQNKHNRLANETQNRTNRELQLNIMRYQQQSQWLNNFREASLAYCHAFNYNDLILVSNIIWDSPKEAFDLIKNLFDRIITTNTKFSFVRKQDEKANKLSEYIDSIYKEYKSTLNDLQWVAVYYMAESNPHNRQQRNFISFLQHQQHPDNNTEHITMLASHEDLNNFDNCRYFNQLVLKIAKKAKMYESNTRDKIYEYIKQEQKHIDNLITENIKS